jgi:hypothetical protein
MRAHRASPHRWPTLAARAFLALILVTAGLGLDPGAANAQTNAPASGQTTSPASPVTIELFRQTTYVGDNEDFQLQLRITAASPDDKSLTVRVYERTVTAADFRANRTGNAYYRSPSLISWRDATDAATQITTVTVSAANIRNSPGVYPVTITVGRTVMRTDLIRLPGATAPGDVIQPLLVGLVLPLTTSPIRTPNLAGGTVVSLPSAERSRLENLLSVVNANPTVPLTLAPSPELVENLGYSTEVADRNLAQSMADARAGREIMGSTYVRVEAEAWRRNGLGLAYGANHAVGVDTLRSFLDVEPAASIGIADPSQGPSTVSMLGAVGVAHFVVDDKQLEPLDGLRYPAPITQKFGIMDAEGNAHDSLAADSYLRGLFEAVGDPVLDANRVLADLAMNAFDKSVRGNDFRRGIVIVAPEAWAPSKLFLDTFIQGLTKAPGLLDPATLTRMFSIVSGASPDAQSAGTQTIASGPLVRNELAADPQSIIDFVDRRNAVESHLSAYRSMIEDENKTDASLNELIRIAGDRRLTTQQSRAFTDVVEDYIATTTQRSIHAPTRQRVTIAGSSAEISLAVDNRSNRPLKVVIRLVSDSRVEFSGPGRTFPYTLAPGLNRVPVQVRTRAAGETPVRIVVSSPDGGIPEIATGQLVVRSAALSGVGIGLSSLALLVLLVWWFRQARRTRRARTATLS